MNVPQYYVIHTLPTLLRNNLALYHVMYEAQRERWMCFVTGLYSPHVRPMCVFPTAN